MKGFDLELELLEDCVISESAATVGGHRCLDYVPGSNLLGAVAARLYKDERLQPEDRFNLFHSGKVRFGNALPLTANGAHGWPIPMCWHHGKRKPWKRRNGHMDADAVWHLGQVQGLPDGLQPKQLRRGYIARDGALANLELRYDVKTAIDPDTARAQNEALFGYEALPAGLTLRASIAVDEDIDDALIDILKNAFEQGLNIGRSRSAQFGRAKVRVQPQDTIDHGSFAGDELVLWLLSDLAAKDANGAPTLTPSAGDLGLGEGALDLEKSFLRSRRYSPYNGFRRAHDLERIVIEQGSVLVFNMTSAPPDPVEGYGYLGVAQEVGLGRVWINPPLLSTPQPQFDTVSCGVDTDIPAVKKPASALLDFLAWRADHAVKSAELEDRVARAVAQYSQLCNKARQLKGLDRGAFSGPSTSQWGNVIAAARNREEDLSASLFDERKGLCRSTMEGWQDEFWDDVTSSRTSFSSWLEALCGQQADRNFVALLARDIMTQIRLEAQT